jgi:hypothetical protein
MENQGAPRETPRRMPRGTRGSRPPVVTLFTDFGHQDPFVGIMKGVILTLCPTAAVVDLCHETAAHDIRGGSYLLWSAVRFFPTGTIHVAVVDPGVGGPRRPILAEIDDQLFVAPDNGLLSYPLASGRVQAVRVITAREYLLRQRSATFHGRDVFAPVAGHLARGVPPERFGPEIHDPVRLPIPRARRDCSGRLAGEIVWIDHFGNCVTNILREDLEALAAGDTRGLRAVLDGREVGPVVQFFAEVAPGGGGAVIGSTGHLELFINQGHLARKRGVAAGALVIVDFGLPIED